MTKTKQVLLRMSEDRFDLLKSEAKKRELSVNSFSKLKIFGDKWLDDKTHFSEEKI